MFEDKSAGDSKQSNITIVIVLVAVLGVMLGLTWFFTS